MSDSVECNFPLQAAAAAGGCHAACASVLGSGGGRARLYHHGGLDRFGECGCCTRPRGMTKLTCVRRSQVHHRLSLLCGGATGLRKSMYAFGCVVGGGSTTRPRSFQIFRFHPSWFRSTARAANDVDQVDHGMHVAALHLDHSPSKLGSARRGRLACAGDRNDRVGLVLGRGARRWRWQRSQRKPHRRRGGEAVKGRDHQ
eukprot:COSAG01_NODE_6710_length_3533_cov_13.464764_4_plen_200_part_00